MHWGWGPDMMGWGGGFFMVIFWVAIIVGIALLVKWLASSGEKAGTSPAESPMEILKRRYAAGEIGKEEFEEKKKDLQG